MMMANTRLKLTKQRERYNRTRTWRRWITTELKLSRMTRKNVCCCKLEILWIMTQRRYHRYHIFGRIWITNIRNWSHCSIMWTTLESGVAMTSAHPSKMSILYIMGINFQLVPHQFLCLMKKRRRSTLLIHILVVGNYFTKYGRIQKMSLWLVLIQIPTDNHIQKNSISYQILGEEVFISHR